MPLEIEIPTNATTIVLMWIETHFEYNYKVQGFYARVTAKSRIEQAIREEFKRNPLFSYCKVYFFKANGEEMDQLYLFSRESVDA